MKDNYSIRKRVKERNCWIYRMKYYLFKDKEEKGEYKIENTKNDRQ